TATPGRPVAAAERRMVADAEHDLAVHLERDQRGPLRRAGREALRAVDRVHDPAPRPRSRLSPLLAEHRVARPFARDRGPHRVFDGLVRLGDDAAVYLPPAAERATEAPKGDRSRGVRETQRECKVVVKGVSHSLSVGFETSGHATRGTPEPRPDAARFLLVRGSSVTQGWFRG